MEIRARYDVNRHPGFETSDDTKVQQHCKDDCDINVILRRYTRTGVLKNVCTKTPRYVDCSSASYKDALDTVLSHQEIFAGLPAKARARFRNDPSLFLAFCEDPNNNKDLLDLGVLNGSNGLVEGQPDEVKSGVV